jgi:16S rRNA (adenine1518-N6/adenine1519-N6)-dimethyltransferase
VTGITDQINALPPLRDVVRDFSLDARKSFGQHYLFDQNLTDRIARSAGPLDDALMVEVGPGPGGLTRSLLRSGAGALVAIEKDHRFSPAMAELAKASQGRFSLVEADALTISLQQLAAEHRCEKVRVAANLPYNVGTQLLINWLGGPPVWKSLTLMFQKEVTERIVAAPGTDQYGRLAILCAVTAQPRLLFDVPAAAFTPPPKVESAVVRLEPLASPYPHLDMLSKITAAAFGQRRKMIRKSLKGLFADLEGALSACELEGEARPETLAPQAFIALSDYALSLRRV